MAISTRISSRSLASRLLSGSSNRKTCGWRTLARPSPGEPFDAGRGIRPVSIAVETPGPGYSEAVPATIEVVELLGHRKNVHLRLGDDKILAIADAGFAGQPGDRVPVHFKTSAAHLFVRESGQRIS